MHALNKQYVLLSELCILTRVHGTRSQQLHWGDWEMGTAISCTGSSQTPGLIQTVYRDSLEAPSLCATVLHTAALHAAVFRELYMHTHTHTHTVTHTHILPLCLATPFPWFLVTLLPTLPDFSTTGPSGE